MNGEKSNKASFGKSDNEHLVNVNNTSTTSSNSNEKYVQIKIEETPLLSTDNSPKSSSSLLPDNITSQNERMSISPISQYFQTHKPLVDYQSDCETVLSNPSTGTLKETHILRNKSVQDIFYTEEHWSSVIKSFVTNAPPKFKEVIKAYRVQSSDKLTLFVKVLSQPPAEFEWFCNDKLITNEGTSNECFQIHNGINVSTLTINSPDQGVYSCSAKNIAGISKSYGYITVDDLKKYKSVNTKNQNTISTIENNQLIQFKKPPKFLNQIPHLILKPGEEALIDVEVSSDSLCRFNWYVDGKKIDINNDNVCFYSPKPNRCIAQFCSPISSQYTVVAENEFGVAKSTGYVEIQTNSKDKAPFYLLPPFSNSIQSPSIENTRRGLTKTTTHTTTLVHRSSSVPFTDYSKIESY